MDWDTVLELGNQIIHLHPKRKEEVSEIISLAMDEINNGASEINELELAYGELEDIFNEETL